MAGYTETLAKYIPVFHFQVNYSAFVFTYYLITAFHYGSVAMNIA